MDINTLLGLFKEILNDDSVAYKQLQDIFEEHGGGKINLVYYYEVFVVDDYATVNMKEIEPKPFLNDLLALAYYDGMFEFISSKHARNGCLYRSKVKDEITFDIYDGFYVDRHDYDPLNNWFLSNIENIHDFVMRNGRFVRKPQ